MDMNIIDLLILGTPEIILTVLVILLLFKRDTLKNSKGKIIMNFMMSCCIILPQIYITRNYFNNLLPHSVITIIFYIIVLKAVWKIETWQSILLGIWCVFFIVFTEMVSSYPIIFDLFTLETFNENRLFLTIPTRLLQILICIAIFKGNFTLSNHVFFKKSWNVLTISNKVTIIFLSIIPLICTLFYIFYLDKLFNLSSLNLKLYFLTLLFIIAALILQNRTRNYESFKEIFKNDIEIIKKLTYSNRNDKEKLELYKKIIDEELHKLENEEKKTI